MLLLLLLFCLLSSLVRQPLSGRARRPMGLRRRFRGGSRGSEVGLARIVLFEVEHPTLGRLPFGLGSLLRVKDALLEVRHLLVRQWTFRNYRNLEWWLSRRLARRPSMQLTGDGLIVAYDTEAGIEIRTFPLSSPMLGGSRPAGGADGPDPPTYDDDTRPPECPLLGCGGN